MAGPPSTPCWAPVGAGEARTTCGSSSTRGTCARSGCQRASQRQRLSRHARPTSRGRPGPLAGKLTSPRQPLTPTSRRRCWTIVLTARPQPRRRARGRGAAPQEPLARTQSPASTRSGGVGTASPAGRARRWK
eukprot:8378585-Lingulodinium_polyedra.AAC.1